MAILNRLRLQGWKTIKDAELQVRNLNVLIGGNSSGKSNLLSFFKMLDEMMAERLQLFIGQSGGADSLLFYGSKTTQAVDAELDFDMDVGTIRYCMRLIPAAVDTLLFADEGGSYRTPDGVPREATPVWSGHKETVLKTTSTTGRFTAGDLRQLVSSCRLYHFHDTSSDARVRKQRYLHDNEFLKSDGANFAPILYGYRSRVPGVYERIRDTVRQVMPQFDDFDMRPMAEDPKGILLNWRERESDLVFGPHQISDGALRSMLLIALLLQPEDDLPRLIAIDEPELGLHPYAIGVIASLIKRASQHCQVIIATQSPTLLDQFDADDVIVVDREKRESTFRRLSAASLQSWLEDYSLSDVWEKNVVGGGPH